MTDDRSAEISERKGQGTSTLIDGVEAAARQAAEGTAAAMGHAASEGRDAAVASLQQFSRRLEDAAQGLPATPRSARMAWRAGRWLGRVEGVMWLGSRGAGIWWRRMWRRLRHQTPNQYVRLILQWGPSVAATGWLLAEVWLRLRPSGKR